MKAFRRLDNVRFRDVPYVLYGRSVFHPAR